jgi:hypothetical protein
MRRPPGPEDHQDGLRDGNGRGEAGFQLGYEIRAAKEKALHGQVKGFEGLEDLGALAFVRR